MEDYPEMTEIPEELQCKYVHEIGRSAGHKCEDLATENGYCTGCLNRIEHMKDWDPTDGCQFVIKRGYYRGVKCGKSLAGSEMEKRCSNHTGKC